MILNESFVEDAALEWFLLRQGYGGQVGEQSRVAPTLIPAFCLRLSALRFDSQREKGKEREAIRRLNPANACGNTGGFKFQREGRRCHEEQTGA